MNKPVTIVLAVFLGVMFLWSQTPDDRLDFPDDSTFSGLTSVDQSDRASPATAIATTTESAIAVPQKPVAAGSSESKPDSAKTSGNEQQPSLLALDRSLSEDLAAESALPENSGHEHADPAVTASRKEEHQAAANETVGHPATGPSTATSHAGNEPGHHSTPAGLPESLPGRITNPFFSSNGDQPAQAVGNPSPQPQTVPVANSQAPAKPPAEAQSSLELSLTEPVTSVARAEPLPPTQPVVAGTPAVCPNVELTRAARQVDYGNALARRGATASARDEFVQALATVAEGRDLVAGDDRHSRSLRLALVILEELADFYRTSNGGTSVTDTAFVIGTHNSGLVSPAEAASLTRLEASRIYAAAAKQHVFSACGRNEICSSALTSMGKLHSIQMTPGSGPQDFDFYASVALHEAALMCHPDNSRSINELGVLHARSGEFALARDCFIASLQKNQTVEGWQNLATAHQRLAQQASGPVAEREMQMADLAISEARRLSSERVQTGDGQVVQWIEPQQFSASSEGMAAIPTANATEPASPATAEPGKGKSGGPGQFFRR